jgi:ABC-type cobalamin/Fe3+-siderophores transport system ATPase subunit
VLEDLTVGFRSKPVLTGISLTLCAGELLVLAGPNGSGKTTLLKTIGGLLKPLAGRILLNGKDTALMTKQERARRMSILFQGTLPGWPFTVQEIVSQGRFPYRGVFGAEQPQDHAAIARAVTAAGLAGFEDRPVTELSGGEFQRVLIARAMAQEAGLLLLDEPANTLDPKYRFMVMTLIRSITGTDGGAGDGASGGACAMVSLHDLNLARLYADRVLLVGDGKIAALGKPLEVLQNDTIGRVYDLSPDQALIL